MLGLPNDGSAPPVVNNSPVIFVGKVTVLLVAVSGNVTVVRPPDGNCKINCGCPLESNDCFMEGVVISKALCCQIYEIVVKLLPYHELLRLP